MHDDSSQVLTDVFYLFVCGRSEKCIRPILEMEANKDELICVIWCLIDENAGTPEIHRRLSTACNEHACRCHAPLIWA